MLYWAQKLDGRSHKRGERMGVDGNRSTKHKGTCIPALSLSTAKTDVADARRHRHRKAEYAKGLEEEKAQLLHMDTLLHSETQKLADQNETIKELLTSRSLATQLDDRITASPQTSCSEPMMEVSASTTRISSSSPEESPTSTATSEPTVAQASYNFAVDPNLEASSRSQIEQCRDLLLRDVNHYE